MKIEFNKVTWYSRLLAWIVFVAAATWFFYVGYQYGTTMVPPPIIPNYLEEAATSTEIVSTSSWYAYQNNAYGFSFKYPKELQTDNPNGMWKYLSSATSTGKEIVQMTVPAIFEMGTNFGDARFSVGVSTDTPDIQNCFLPTMGETASSSVYINGKLFYKFTGTDVGAGNFYQVESYRTIHNNACYDIDLIIHSTNIGNYPASFGIKPFDYNKIHNLLSEMLNTFVFSGQ